MSNWINSAKFAGYRSCSYRNGLINGWLDNPCEDLYI